MDIECTAFTITYNGVAERSVREDLKPNHLVLDLAAQFIGSVQFLY